MIIYNNGLVHSREEISIPLATIRHPPTLLFRESRVASLPRPCQGQESRVFFNYPNRRTVPSCEICRSEPPAIPGRADPSAPSVAGPTPHPRTAPPLHGRCARRLPAPPRFHLQCPALSNPWP